MNGTVDPRGADIQRTPGCGLWLSGPVWGLNCWVWSPWGRATAPLGPPTLMRHVLTLLSHIAECEVADRLEPRPVLRDRLLSGNGKD